ncbi:hypothetical protein PQI66_09570 [Corynebacterium sp. USCH3]|uniref:hypothetical protein n=1 Tax=Corynebacterium sp. USCH3 TaxID=3024840 RepID=UPI0030B32E94
MTPQDQSPPHPMTRHRRLLLHLWCIVLTGVVFWPFLATLVSYAAPGSDPVSLILRDMVVPHSMALNDLATGRDGLPRAIPQDTVLAWLSPVIPPPVTVSILMLVAGYIGALGAAALARQVGSDRAGSPASTLAGSVAATVTLWNPFVAERLLQGHWSVVLAGILLPAVAVCAMRRSPASLVALVALLALCALTPTGLILATVTAVMAALASPAPARRVVTVLATAVVFSLPWVVPTLVTAGADATRTDAAGAALFAARAEPGVGTLGALAGLGGIWNADAVPASRDTLAPVSTGAGVVLAVAVAVAAVLLMRRRRLRGAPLVWLALAAVVVPALMSTGPGIAVTGWFLEQVPGAGLVRDGQKFVVLALPGLVVVLGQGLSRLPRGRQVGAAAVVLTLVWVSVPALPRDVADIAPVELDRTYDELAEQVAAWQDDHGATARTLLWPPGNYRMIGDRPALDPSLKMLPGRPLDPGYLIVDGALVDGNPETLAVLTELAGGEDTLEDRGIDLVVVEDGGDSRGVADVLNEHVELWSSGRWSLYAVDR